MRSFALNRVTRGLLIALRLAVFCFALTLVSRTFVVIGWLQPVVVSGDSMAPTLSPGDRLLVRRWRAPLRWDVVVLRSPVDASTLLVKRVVGLPGERVALREGKVWVDDTPIEPRNHSHAAGVYYGAFGSPEWLLGDDEWFVVGDHPLVSIDSRNWAAAAGVPSRLIVGVVAEPSAAP